MPGPDERAKRSESGRAWMRDAAPFLTMGLELAFAVVGMFFIGRWLDGLLGIAPWGMYGGLVFGVTGGFIRFFMRAIAMGNQQRSTPRE